MSVSIGEVNGSRSITSDYEYSSKTAEKTNTAAAQQGDTVERCASDSTSAAPPAPSSAETVPGLIAGFLALMGGGEIGRNHGMQPEVGLIQTLSFIVNLAALLRANGADGSPSDRAEALKLLGQSAMQQAGKDKGAVTELAKGYDKSGQFDERVGWRADGSARTSGSLGSAEGKYHAEAEARVAGQGSVHAGVDGAEAQGSVYAGARVEAEAEGHLESTPVNVAGYPVSLKADGKAEAEAGACATAKGEAVVSYAPPEASVECEAGAFAGARAGVEADIGVGPAKVKGEAEAWAGVGATANFNVGFKDGKLTFDYGAGAALGIGAHYGGSVEIDVNDLMKGLLGATDFLLGPGLGIPVKEFSSLEDMFKALREAEKQPASPDEPIMTIQNPAKPPAPQVQSPQQSDESEVDDRDQDEDRDDRAVEQR